MAKSMRWAVVVALLSLALPGAVLGEGGLEPSVDSGSSQTSPTCVSPGPDRPYICDVGPPKPLSWRSFEEVLAHDDKVRELVRRIGLPDRAELQQIDADWPWLAWEIRTYYERYNRVYAFGRAFVLDRPEISVLRYQGPIPPAVVSVGLKVGPLDRLERAAQAAERAAEAAERAADQADRFADRAGATADQMGDEFKSSLRKH
jgi:hypothetical protein